MNTGQQPKTLMDTRLRVEYQQTWIVRIGSFVEEFPEQWKEAQQRGLDEREFALESIKIMGEDVRDLSERDDDDWDVMTL